jgi:Na+/melibiose symporter-like transporter
MFSLLYELLGGKNDNPVYEESIFPAVGLFTIILSVLFAVIFYVLLGRWRPVWDKQKHWLITMILLALIASGLAYSQARNGTEDDADAYMFTFSMINALYAVVYFVILSLLFKRASIFAKRTPF